MNDDPEYDISEFLLAGLFIAGSLASFVWAGASLWARELPSFSEGCGLSLMLLGGSVHPKKYIVDCFTFPFTVMERSGRETPITIFGAGLGLALWLAGVLGNHFS
jgi:hypothetical protein